MLTRRSVTMKPPLSTRKLTTSADLEEEQIAELKASSAYNLSYPDLPPTLAYRRGLSRRSLSQGIAYALPVDHSALNSKNLYRVDLRAMFQDPYRSTAHTFDEDRLLSVSSMSHRPKTAKLGYKQELQQVMRKCLPSYSSDSSMMRAASTFPAAGTATVTRLCSAGPRNRDLFSPARNQLRSKLSQHIEDQGHNEIQKIAFGILKELDMEIKDDFYEQVQSEKGSTTERAEAHKKLSKQAVRCITPSQRRSQLNVSVATLDDPNTPPEDPCEEIPKKNVDLRLQIAEMQDFSKFKKMGPEYRPPMPESARSPFISDVTNAKIWNWLTEDQVVNKFDYFMFLCAKQ